MNFRDTGQKDSGNVISRDSTYLSANDGLLIPACNADKSIIVYDVLSYGAGTLGTAADGGGTRLGFINAGHNEYGVSLIVPAGQGVYTNAQSGNITITYAVVDGLPASRITNVAQEEEQLRPQLPPLQRRPRPRPRQRLPLLLRPEEITIT